MRDEETGAMPPEPVTQIPKLAFVLEVAHVNPLQQPRNRVQTAPRLPQVAGPSWVPTASRCLNPATIAPNSSASTAKSVRRWIGLDRARESRSKSTPSIA